MTSITEEQLTFVFPNDDWKASKFDQWSFYRNQFQKVCGGAKAIDILAIHDKCLYVIEVKDYRRYKRTKLIELPAEVAAKVRDSLSAIVAAAMNANDAEEKRMARSALRCSRLKVVLHLEQPSKRSKLYPREIINPSLVIQSLKKLLKAIDPHPQVVDRNGLSGLGWKVS